jgi:hypothetical protein
MKLRNKKTGEIGYLIVGRGSDHYVVANNEWNSCGKYDSLAELNAEWEDYEEPEKYFWIDVDGYVTSNDTSFKDVAFETFRQNLKSIGNYFVSKEEAEKSVEKLKALKRLKDAKFRIKEYSYRPIEAYNASEQKYNTISADGRIKFSMFCYEDFSDDLDLLFGGENDY